MLSSMLRTTATIKLPLLGALLGLTTLVTGCASAPEQPAPRSSGRIVVEPRGVDMSVGNAIAELAMGMVGTRYSYGGANPAEGFDCSGLVFYAYTQAGYDVPRTSQAQFRAARKIALGDAAAGDLMFFQDQSKLSHVAIYLGDGLFVHAPSTGQKVAIESLDSAYYQQHLVAVARLLPR